VGSFVNCEFWECCCCDVFVGFGVYVLLVDCCSVSVLYFGWVFVCVVDDDFFWLYVVVT